MRVPTIIPTRHLVLTKSDEEKGAKEEVSLHMRERHHTGWLLTVAPLVPFCPLFSAHPRKRKGFSAVGVLELNLLFTGLCHQSPIKLPYPFLQQATKHPWPGTGGRVIRRQATPHLHRTRRSGRRGPLFLSPSNTDTHFIPFPLASDLLQTSPPLTPQQSSVTHCRTTCCCPCARALSSENTYSLPPTSTQPHAGLVLKGREKD